MNVRRTLQERLSAHRALLGLIQTQPSITFAQIAAIAGYDFVILDDEHGTFSDLDILHVLQAFGSTNTAALVRLRGHDMQAVGRFLDMGADGIVVPDVRTAEQADAFVKAMNYPPTGTRGFGAAAHRVTRYGLDVPSHLKSPRAGTSLLAIIESALGLANAEEIVSVDGVDGVLIGPSDLSANLGCPGDFSSAVYGEAMAQTERAASMKGKLLGTAPHAGHPMEALFVRGHRLFILGADMPLIREAMCTQVSKARNAF